jgi:putative ABC transport system substrate-binding protein
MDRIVGSVARSPRMGPRLRSRRCFLQGLVGASVGGMALMGGCQIVSPPGQQPRGPSRIGVLSAESPGSSPLSDAFVRGLRELGWFEGQNVALEYRFAQGRLNLLHDLAAELLGLKVDVIVALGSEAARAAKIATATVPIVAVGMTADPVAQRLVASLDRPGGNLTGLSTILVDHGTRLVGLLRTLEPSLARVGVLWNTAYRQLHQPGRPFSEAWMAAQATGLALQPLEVVTARELDAAFAGAIRGRAQALIVYGDPLTFIHRMRIFDFAAQHGLPAVYDLREFADEGGLMAYGPSLRAMYRRSAAYVDLILKGVSPADLPVERPGWAQFVVNLGTAQSLGLTIPPAILGQAHELIG